MRKYEYILFDIDDTLPHFEYTERNIMRQIFASEGKEITEQMYRELWQISWDNWDRFHLNDVHDSYVQENYHRLYREELRDAFFVYFMNERNEYEDTELILQFCSEVSKVAIASNGLGKVQRSRMEKYVTYIKKFFISEELGVIKANRSFWDKVFADIGVKPEQCLMVGDSFSNDIVSAALYGMDTCWVNREGKVNTTGVVPTYEVRTLCEIKEI